MNKSIVEDIRKLIDRLVKEDEEIKISQGDIYRTKGTREFIVITGVINGSSYPIAGFLISVGLNCCWTNDGRYAIGSLSDNDLDLRQKYVLVGNVIGAIK